MSKERIEEIEKLDVSLLEGTKFHEHWLWLIEQWHLDDKVFSDLDSDYIDIKQQNKRYQETLKFYADRKNWKGTVKGRSLYDGILDYGHTPIQIDEGMKAQRVLEEYKNELE